MSSPPGALTDLLACPKCHGPLRVVDTPTGWACEACALLYGLERGIPNFLLDDARPWAPGGPEPH